ncbi:DUF484 family protein [Thiohalocapsa marina]|uniref:DUF484 family protein n=1 Tax=Thiohalocapsa marina TaxID=424902 RepID=A0A5M8FNR1_9GAMM|nr:DUF484 family protein [Thiohalocapsa marina]KAA6186563.1 DUF484 family protein [Thiohalocapsa marina]
MSASPEAGPVVDALQDQAVADYLRQHPDFLQRHPDVLAALSLVHGVDGAVSLLERQVRVLREQLSAEQARLDQLVARAHDNQRLANRLHELTLRLILARDLPQAHAALEESLRAEFSADAVVLKLFPVDLAQHAGDPLVSAFLDFIDQDRCLCGPLQGPQFEQLFGDAPAPIQSAALIPLRGRGQSGVLAIGSRDPAHFSHDMGTDLLERLGAIASARLAALVEDDTGTRGGPETQPAVAPGAADN